MSDAILKWDLNVEKIGSTSKSLMEETRKRCQSIIESDKRDQEVLKSLNELEIQFLNGLLYTELVRSVFPSKEIRDAAKDSASELKKLAIEIKMNKNLYDVLESTLANVTGKLDAESQRYIERQVLERKLSGLHLDEATRKRVQEINEKISDLCVEYSKNCDEESTKLTFTADQLKGVNQNLLNSLPKNESGEFIVSLSYPVYFPIMKECSVPETRRKMNIAFDSRNVGENVKLLEETLELRAQLAKILNYKNYSEYALALLCAKSPDNVQSFLDRLASKMRSLQKTEMSILLEYKQKDCEENGIPFNGKLNPSDTRYYLNQREKKEFNVDHAKLQEYFPLQVVLDGTLKIYQTLLSLKFEEVTDAPKYVDDMRCFKVYDTLTNEVVGYFYLDLHPRDGKYGHAAVFPLRKGCKLSNQLPVCMMVCNFTKPTSDQPSLLTHDEVETFFHEFGHVMHNVCTKANYAKFGGTSVERDFVEAPSQMLENWVWKKESLRLLSAHYKDGSAIDDKLIDDLIKSKNSSSGSFNMRQIMLAKMDQHFHTNDKSDTTNIYKQFFKEYALLDLEAEGLNMNASFQHLMGGYEAQYYSYLWSEVYSQDMFESRFGKEGIMNPKTGLDYRRCILEPGGSISANEMVKNFLGREPNEDAFLRNKGVEI